MAIGRSRARARALIPLVFLSLGATLFGLVAWRESARARATTELLTRDYAAFIAESFSRHAESRFGLPAVESAAQNHPRAELLRSIRSARLVRPTWPGVRYYFLYEPASRKLDLVGEAPGLAERAELRELVEGLTPACGAEQTVPYGQLRNVGRLSFESALAISGWLRTGPDGSVVRLVGARYDEDVLVNRRLRQLIENEICECPTLLLPESLASVGDNTRAAHFVLRDASGRIRYESGTSYASSGPALRELPRALPLVGWTLEVSVNPAVVDALLPYGGRDVPWLAFALLFSLVTVSSVSAVMSFRRSAALARSQEDFVSNVSHELRTPLTRIRLFNEILLTGGDDGKSESAPSKGKAAHYRRVIDRECRRLDHLISNVLDVSQKRRGARGYRMERLDLNEVVNESLELFRSASYDERLGLLERLDQVPTVSGDRAALQQVLINLLDNAVKYSPEGSPIEVTLARRNGHIELVVSDEGPGIPPEERLKIFEPFYRRETGETQRVAGSGLGLALVRETVEAHGGRIRVEGAADTGSSFVVELPTG